MDRGRETYSVFRRLKPGYLISSGSPPGGDFTGPQGSQGATLPPSNGSTGGTGLSGFLGFLGPVGSQGLQGSNGSTGVIGFQGNLGVGGSVGAQGSTGLQGVTGQQGFDGSLGSVGVQGSQGSDGNSGNGGAVGFVGFIGSSQVGPQGSQGIIGHQGFPGVIGLQGPGGGTGPQGFAGSQGNTGAMLMERIYGTGIENFFNIPQSPATISTISVTLPLITSKRIVVITATVESVVSFTLYLSLEIDGVGPLVPPQTKAVDIINTSGNIQQDTCQVIFVDNTAATAPLTYTLILSSDSPDPDNYLVGGTMVGVINSLY